MPIDFASGLPDPIYTKEGREIVVIYRLLAVERLDYKESLPIAINLATIRLTS